ncbi:hypothetical protein N7478_007079 [Penicillium angulare]|uniref:uncharacterized protein n=1 Tax=Penicillium angulare TaxID=116970 RepID=UPI0025400F29|nr:uncharacterized protein N7478_007079 [Penicillium angulare]KAJ5281707.1 hypothetical protein N7478_007079 [Penicillium angulare]
MAQSYEPYEPNEPPTHIPSFVRQLTPYVKTEQETLRIRQVLTSYLRSLIVFNDDTAHASHLALCAPADAVQDVKRIPIELTGLRKEYLKALQANVAARKEFNGLSDDVASLRRQRVSRTRPADPADPQEPGADLRDYLLLLRDRRRHSKLQIFQHYLEEFRQKGATTVDLGEESIAQQSVLPEGLETDTSGGRNGTDTDLDGLVHKLERAVVRARTQLDQEKRLFEKAKAQHDSREETSEDLTTAVKAQALQRTRDELVQWVEERLVSEVDPDESLVQDMPPEEIEKAQRLLEEQKAHIKEQYEAYLQARRQLLDVASRACQPATVPPKPPSRSTYRMEIPPEEISPPIPVDVLSYATETLIPLSKSQKSLALQKSYLSALLAKEKSTTLRALHRLRDESHLLHEYPMLAHQPRFKHAVAALSSRNSSQSPDEKQSDELVSLAEAWSFASDAAASNEREYIQQKLLLGTEVNQDARKVLGDVYGTLNQDLDSVLQEGVDPEQRTTDIWTSEARTVRGTGDHSGSRLEKRPKGPWSGLSGRIGVE